MTLLKTEGGWLTAPGVEVEDRKPPTICSNTHVATTPMIKVAGRQQGHVERENVMLSE
jgi:hypothetical protein